MSTILTHAVITSANDKVDAYVLAANSCYQELDSLINSLLSNYFLGDAADGYRAFYTEKIVPALTENLTAPANSLTAGIKSMLDSIQQQLLDTIDPALGDNNRNPGAE